MALLGSMMCTCAQSTGDACRPLGQPPELSCPEGCAPYHGWLQMLGGECITPSEQITVACISAQAAAGGNGAGACYEWAEDPEVVVTVGSSDTSVEGQSGYLMENQGWLRCAELMSCR